MVEARIGQLQAERVFPSESITHRRSLLAIGQTFQELEDGDQCQPPRGESWLPVRRKQVEPSSHPYRCFEAASRTCMTTLPRGKIA